MAPNTTQQKISYHISLYHALQDNINTLPTDFFLNYTFDFEIGQFFFNQAHDSAIANIFVSALYIIHTKLKKKNVTCK